MMVGGKHTPGPWILRDDGFNRALITLSNDIVMEEGMNLQVTPTNSWDWVLMSAAPELLDALILLVNANAVTSKRAKQEALKYAMLVIDKARSGGK